MNFIRRHWGGAPTTMCALCIAFFVTAGGAAAEGSREAYSKAITAALAELELGNYAEAHAQFAVAHGLAPSARTHRGLGVAAFEMRQYPEAETALAAALSSDVRPLDERMRAQTEELLARTRTYLGTLTVEVVPEDAKGVALLVDHQLIGTPSDALRLSVGAHELEVRAEGYRTEQRSVRMGGGQNVRLRVQLTKVSLAVAEGPAAGLNSRGPLRQHSPMPEAPRQDDESLWESPWLWTGVGGVVVAAAVVTVVLVATPTQSTETPYSGSSGIRFVGP